MMTELQNDCKAWETKRDSLITECGLIEKQATNMIREAKESLDKIRFETAEALKERDTARSELKQLKALVGSKGTVADLAKQKEDVIEAYFNPKKPRLPTPANDDRRE